ncbi:Cytochrome b-c1 complex subunit 7 [Gryllus bimaculatus]|nr:Cytochrome b-c1 complex subunit 7 [Gryllus bimaculatus]
MAVRQATGFMGLRHDDLLNNMRADVQEAVRRLPQHLVDERNFRLIRAMQLSLTKSYLPKEEWTKWEEDERYLQPYLEEVQKEMEERAEWNTK